MLAACDGRVDVTASTRCGIAVARLAAVIAAPAAGVEVAVHAAAATAAKAAIGAVGFIGRVAGAASAAIEEASASINRRLAIDREAAATAAEIALRATGAVAGIGQDRGSAWICPVLVSAAAAASD